jgi:hypothetical protein
MSTSDSWSSDSWSDGTGTLRKKVERTAEFIRGLEKTMHRRLTLQKRGPHETVVTDRRQGELTFDP